MLLEIAPCAGVRRRRPHQQPRDAQVHQAEADQTVHGRLQSATAQQVMSTVQRRAAAACTNPVERNDCRHCALHACALRAERRAAARTTPARQEPTTFALYLLSGLQALLHVRNGVGEADAGRVKPGQPRQEVQGDAPRLAVGRRRRPGSNRNCAHDNSTIVSAKARTSREACTRASSML